MKAPSIKELLPEYIQQGNSCSAKYLVVFSEKKPRWIIPQDPSLATSTLRCWQPYSKVGRLKWAILLALYKMRLLKFMKNIAQVSIRTKAGLTVVAYIGTPGQNQKTVLTIISNTHSPSKYILKHPIGKNAAASICHEEEILENIACVIPGVAPKLQQHASWQAKSQEWIEGPITQSKISMRHVEFLLKLKRNNIANIRQTIEFIKSKAIETKSTIGHLSTAISEVAENSIALVVPSVIVHGDFSPWNLKITPDKSIIAIDWEEARMDGIPLEDLLQFHLKNELVLGDAVLFGWTQLTKIIESRETQAYLQALGISSSCQFQLALLALIKITLYWNSTPEGVAHPFGEFLSRTLTRVMSEKQLEW